MPRYAVYTLANSRRDYWQFFELQNALAYAARLGDKAIIWDRLRECRVKTDEVAA